MKKFLIIASTLFFTILLAVFFQPVHPQVQESITFFPIDPQVKFKSAVTSLKPVQPNTLLWRIQSTIDRRAYLRQDAGLLFANGRLIAELHHWQQNTSHLQQEKQVDINGSALLEAISFHHAELHEKGGRIFSSQTMSDQQLYVVTLNKQEQVLFSTPQTSSQEKWKQILENQTKNMLQLSWNKAVRRYSIPLQNFLAYPLADFNRQAKKGLPGFTKEETDKITGNLWEGLYKNYLLGIKKQDGSIVSPIGSTMPLILIAKDKTQLFVISEDSGGAPIFLRQMIEDID